jgi:hypothetical protein
VDCPTLQPLRLNVDGRQPNVLSPFKKFCKWSYEQLHPGIKLLEHEIPLDRKCKDAMIPPPRIAHMFNGKGVRRPISNQNIKKVWLMCSIALLHRKGCRWKRVTQGCGSHDDLRNTFVEHCYVHRTEYGDHAVAFEEADFDIETFDSIVSLESLKVGAKIAFRASFVGNVVRSPEEIVPIFAVVGEGYLDGTGCPISMSSWCE